MYQYLPTDIQIKILTYLSGKEIVNTMLCNRNIKNVIKNEIHKYTWEKDKEFPPSDSIPYKVKLAELEKIWENGKKHTRKIAKPEGRSKIESICFEAPVKNQCTNYWCYMNHCRLEVFKDDIQDIYHIQIFQNYTSNELDKVLEYIKEKYDLSKSILYIRYDVFFGYDPDLQLVVKNDNDIDLINKINRVNKEKYKRLLKNVTYYRCFL